MKKILQEISFAEKDNVKEARIIYAIKSDILIPTNFTNLLSIQAEESYAKGDKYPGKIYDPVKKVASDTVSIHPFGLWSIDTGKYIAKKNTRPFRILTWITGPEKR
jgi:hypothetical protein